MVTLGFTLRELQWGVLLGNDLLEKSETWYLSTQTISAFQKIRNVTHLLKYKMHGASHENCWRKICSCSY